MVLRCIKRKRPQGYEADDDDAPSNNNDEGQDHADSEMEKDEKSCSAASTEETESVQIGSELDMMLEVIMKLRSDLDFAKSMYGDCPRLQHLLNRNPDLRPIFEDPTLITLNFEKVYRDKGGVLPEDLEKLTWFQRTKRTFFIYLRIILNSRAFKIFRCLLIIKKLAGFVSPFKAIGIVKGCIRSMLCGCCENPDELLEELEGADIGPPPSEARMALEKAAEYMEDPEVQEEMNQMMENPDTLQDAIDQNENLKNLRDSNPVCKELMSDPDTMKILTDPDNLRALGDAPDLIEADYADVNFEPPEVEVDYGGGESDLPGIEEGDEMDLEAEEEEELAPAEEEEGGVLDDQEFEYEEPDDRGGRDRGRSGGKARQQQKKKQQQSGEGRGNAFTEAAVGFLGGALVSEVMGGFGGGGDELEGLDQEMPEGEVPEVDEPEFEEPDIMEPEDPALLAAAAMAVTGAGDNAEAFDELAGNAEDIADDLEEAAEDDENDQRDREARAAGAGAAGGVAVAGGPSRYADDEEEEEEEEEPEKKGRFGFLGTAASAMADVVKESTMAAFVGDDIAEMAMDRMEEEDEEEEDEDHHEDDVYFSEDEDEDSIDFPREQGAHGQSRADPQSKDDSDWR